MTVHDPVDKNLKHKTDVMSWEELPWEDCDLNFRPPVWSKLSLSLGAVYGQLLLATAIVMAGATVLGCWVVPLILGNTSWSEVVVVAAVVGLMAASGWYRPLPRAAGKQASPQTGLLVVLSIVLFYGTARLSVVGSSFDSGVLLLFVIAIPSCLFAADQLTGHMLHWWSADPGVSRNLMVAWRNAWCGRFMTEHVDELCERGVATRNIQPLKWYWCGHVAVPLVYACSLIISLCGALLLQIAPVGPLFVFSSTSLLLVVFALVDLPSPRSRRNISRIFGHWFLYLKDSAQPAWVLQSPAGPQLGRAFLSYTGAGALGIAYWLLGLAETPVLPASVLHVGMMGVIAVFMAPLHWILICLIVAIPTLSHVKMGLTHEPTAGDQS